MVVFNAISQAGTAIATGRLLSATDAVYANAQSGVGSFSGSPFGLEVGQAFNGANYTVYRAGLSFASSAIGSNVVASATLSVYSYNDYSDTDFNLTVINGSALADPLVDADYQDLLASTASFGSVSSTAFASTGYKNIPLNAAGIAAISSSGTTRFGLRSSRDISAVAATGLESIQYETTWSDGWPATHPPTLTVSYVPGESAGAIAVVGETFHYVSKTGVEYVVQGTPV